MRIRVFLVQGFREAMDPRPPLFPVSTYPPTMTIDPTAKWATGRDGDGPTDCPPPTPETCIQVFDYWY